MANYRIFVPARKGSEMPDITINVEASNWLVALKEGLKKIGEQGDSLSNILCETGEDGSMRVADPATKRVFVIKEVEVTGEASAEDLLMKEAEERASMAAVPSCGPSRPRSGRSGPVRRPRRPRPPASRP